MFTRWVLAPAIALALVFSPMVRNDQYDHLFQEHAPKGVDWRWLKAQAIAESNLDRFAVSKAGAMGLVQFMPKTWDWIAGDDASPFSPKHAITYQGKYMGYLLGRVGGDLDKALAAYNWGEGNVKEAGERWRDKMPAETRAYVGRVRRLFDDMG